MGKIKKWYRSIPIWLAFILIVGVFLMIAIICSKVTVEFAGEKTSNIVSKYCTPTYEKQVAQSNGENAVKIFMNYNFEDYSPEDMRLYKLFTFIQNYAYLFWYSICVILAGIVFYFSKLRMPLVLLKNASKRIAENELDFILDYSGTDEMAKLCNAFEQMRVALDENNHKMLHIVDERKQLNDAYTHDLRTPIAVLKGYTDMLVKYLPEGKLPPEKILNTIKTMSSHVARLEQFVDSMNTIQKLDDLSIQQGAVTSGDFLGHLRESAQILCKGAGLSCVFEATNMRDTLYLDPSAVIQVYENLLSNATRFAKSTVIVRFFCESNTFSIEMLDDGKGFSNKDLLKATHPYYSGQSGQEEYHFGLGLHICQTLCEKHGGLLYLENSPTNGAKITAQFSMVIK